MLTLSIGRKKFNVASLSEASVMFQNERDDAECFGDGGASNFPTGMVRDGKKLVARISYNGRVWNPTPANGDALLIMEAANYTPRDYSVSAMRARILNGE